MTNLSFEKLTNIIAETYKTSVLKEVNMKTATEHYEIIRGAFSGSSNIFDTLKVVDRQLGVVQDNKLLNILISLKEQIKKVLFAEEIELVHKKFSDNYNEGLNAWLKLYVKSLNHWYLDFCNELTQDNFPFSGKDKELVIHTKRMNKYIMHERWAESYQFFSDLAGKKELDPEERIKLLVTAGEIQLYHLLDSQKAKIHFDEAAGIDSRNLKALVGIGEYHLKNDKIEEAKSCFENSINAQNNSGDAYYLLGECYEK